MCAQWRLRSAWASVRSGRKARLIWVFAGFTCHFVGFVMLWFSMQVCMHRVKRIWYLPPMRAAKVQASLSIRAVLPEPSLLAHTSSESRGTFRQKARSLAPMNGWACAVKMCHDGMLEDTNLLDGARIMLTCNIKLDRHIPLTHYCLSIPYKEPWQTVSIPYKEPWQTVSIPYKEPWQTVSIPYKEPWQTVSIPYKEPWQTVSIPYKEPWQTVSIPYKEPWQTVSIPYKEPWQTVYSHITQDLHSLFCVGSILPVNEKFGILLKSKEYEPRHEKACFWGFRPGKTQTGLLSYKS